MAFKSGISADRASNNPDLNFPTMYRKGPCCTVFLRKRDNYIPVGVGLRMFFRLEQVFSTCTEITGAKNVFINFPCGSDGRTDRQTDSQTDSQTDRKEGGRNKFKGVVRKFVVSHYLNSREAKQPYNEGVYILPTSREMYKDGAVFLLYTSWLHFMDTFSISLALASS